MNISVPGPSRPYVIVLGNEKGGTGKSTMAVHLAAALLQQGYRVGTIDVDSRQHSLSRYLENRRAYAEEIDAALALPEHRRVERSSSDSAAQAEAQDRSRVRRAFAELQDCQFIVVDTPGSDSILSRLAHESADTLITPLNDSFLDLDVLAQIDRRRREVLGPSAYSQMVWEQNNRRVLGGRPPIDWIVLRNRLSHIEARNKREISTLLTQLGRRIGFRLAPGFGERVIFRELFLKGLTLLDLPEDDPDITPTDSHLSAKREIRSLMETIGLSEVAFA